MGSETTGSSREHGSGSGPPGGPTLVTRRRALVALAAGLGGLATVLPGAGRGLGWLPGFERVSPTPGDPLTPEQLRDLLVDGLGDTLPVYLPSDLPSGWQPAPFAARSDVDATRRAVFVNPAYRPGFFYRVGYTRDNAESLDDLITLTVRRDASFPDILDEQAAPMPREAYVVGSYLNVPVSSGGGLGILVQGLADDEEAVRHIAARVVPV